MIVCTKILHACLLTSFVCLLYMPICGGIGVHLPISLYWLGTGVQSTYN